MLDSIGHVGRVVNLGHQFQIVDALADGDSELVSIGDSGKCFSGTLAPVSFAQKVFVAREQNSAEMRGPIQQFGVLQDVASVFLRGQHIHAAPPEKGSVLDLLTLLRICFPFQIQQSVQIARAAHSQLFGNPRCRHRRLRPQSHRDAHFLRIVLA